MFNFSRNAILGSIAMLTFASMPLVHGQTVEWLHQFGSSDRDYGEDISLDGLGNIYVSGLGDWGGSGTGIDIWTKASVAKFDVSGNRLWTRLVEPIAARNGQLQFLSVSADSLGNVFFSGTTKGDIGGPNFGETDAFVGKYNANGSLLWTRQFGTDRFDSNDGVKSDGLGNVYVSGTKLVPVSGESWGQNDAFLSKYDTNGALLWSRQYGSVTASESAVSVAVDRVGNVYVSGQVASQPEGHNYYGSFLAKYDSLGNAIWDTHTDVGLDRAYFAKAVAADSLGNVYQTGDGPNGAVFLNRFDFEGNLSWTRQLFTTELTSVYEVSVDEVGNAFVAGRTMGDLGGPYQGGASGDAFIAKYSPSGDLAYIWQFGTERSDIAQGVAVDAQGNLYVSGATGGTISGPNQGSFDAFVLKRSGAVPEPNSLMLAGLALLPLRRWANVVH